MGDHPALSDEAKVLGDDVVVGAEAVRGCNGEADFQDRSLYANPYSKQRKKYLENYI